jgi:hypothetical protein
MPNNNYVRRNFYQGHDPMFIPSVTAYCEEITPASAPCGCENTCGPCYITGPTGATGATSSLLFSISRHRIRTPISVFTNAKIGVFFIQYL